MKTIEADVIVISAGTAGLPAATTAAQNGAKVAVFEMKRITGGTAYAGGQIMGVGSAVQKRKGIDLTPDQIYKLHMDYVKWRADARLVRTFYQESGKTIDWFESLGIPVDVMNGPGEYKITHQAKGWIKTVTEKAVELGVDFHFKTAAKKLIKEDGKITGVIAETDDGEQIIGKAKAVIIACGGFGNNPEMMKEYTGFEYGVDMFNFRIPGSNGDGIKMAWEAGGAKGDMMMQVVFSCPHPYEGAVGVSFEFMEFSQASNLIVNLLGERFLDEEIIKDTSYGGNAIVRQKGRAAFAIFEQNIKEFYDEEGLEGPMMGGKRMGGRKKEGGPPVMGTLKLEDMMKRMKETEDDVRSKGLGMVFADTLKEKGNEDLDTLLKKALDRGYKHFFVADTLEELCEKTGIDLEGLKATIADYNAACEKGVDDAFGKNPKYLLPLKGGKYYACRFFPTAYGSLGGIKINYKTQVLDSEDRPIPGLYAAGTDAADIYGDTYTRFLYGNTQGFCTTTGRMAGRNAAEYAKS